MAQGNGTIRRQLARTPHFAAYAIARKAGDAQKLRVLANKAHKAGVLFVFVCCMLAMARQTRSGAALDEMEAALKGKAIVGYAKARAALCRRALQE